MHKNLIDERIFNAIKRDLKHHAPLTAIQRERELTYNAVCSVRDAESYEAFSSKKIQAYEKRKETLKNKNTDPVKESEISVLLSLMGSIQKQLIDNAKELEDIKRLVNYAKHNNLHLF